MDLMPKTNVTIPPRIFYSTKKPDCLEGFEIESDSEEEIFYVHLHRVDRNTVIPPSPPRTSYSPTSCVSLEECASTTSKSVTMVEYCDHGMRIARRQKPENVLPQYGTIVSPGGSPQGSALDCQSAAAAAGGHWPLCSGKRQRCKQKTPKCCQFSSFECFQCRKHFCIRKSNNCFTDFHRIHSNIKFPTAHLPEFGSKRQNCAYCKILGRQGLSAIKCAGCNIYLCLRKTKDCFADYHTKPLPS